MTRIQPPLQKVISHDFVQAKNARAGHGSYRYTLECGHHVFEKCSEGIRKLKRCQQCFDQTHRRKKRRRLPIAFYDGDVFKTESGSAVRRVVGLVNGTVMYSTGGDHNKQCSARTFRQWVSRNRCGLIHRNANGEWE